MNKQIISNLAIAILSIVTVFANNSEPTLVSNGNSFTIDSKVWKSELVNVEITDAAGQVLFSDQQLVAIAKQYNLAELPNGTYTVAVSNDIKTVTSKVELSAGNIAISYDVETIYKPIIKIGTQAIDLNYLTNQATTVEIYNEDEQLYTTVINTKGTINRRFNIEQLPAGNYTLVVANTADSYRRTFNK